jgi:iron complex transport system substrate-binding protein
MRIASLVPSATEALFALGFGDEVVAVTHECDWPQAAARLPRLTASVLPDGLSAGEIDSRVRELTGAGQALYTLDEETLARLDPDLIVTQELCAVCAVSYEEVCDVAVRLPGGRARVVSLDPGTLSEVIDDLVVLGEACGDAERGAALARVLRDRLESVREAVAGAARRRVLALEWLDPPYVGGHWVPEMISIAGGIDVAGVAGERSRVVEWRALAGLGAEVAVVLPCGYYVDQALAEAEERRGELEGLGVSSVFAVDAAASFSRPGPRLVEGVELLAHLLHPELVAAPRSVGFAPLPMNVPH